MDVNKLPPSLLVTLGLAGCGPAVDVPPEQSTEGGTQESLEGPMSEPTTTACLGCTPEECSEVGTTTAPCLIPPYTTTGPCLDVVTGCLSPPYTTTGPCLEPPTSGSFIDPSSDSGSGSSSDSGSGSSSDSGSSSSGSSSSGSSSDSGSSTTTASAHDRAERLRRLIDAGILPADLADRLRGRA